MIAPNLYSQRAATRLRDYLMDEIATAEAARRQKEEIWIDCHEAYYAQSVPPLPGERQFPFQGRSNLVIPVIATDVETVFSRMMGLLFEPESLFSMTASMPEMGPVAPRIEEFMKWSQHNEVDWQSPVGDWILEILKLGTGVLKQRYNREVKKVFEWRELQGQTWQQQALILLKDAPTVHRVPLFDFYGPPGFRSLKEMPWVCEDVWLTWRQFQSRMAAGIYQPTAKITEAWATSTGSRVESELQRLAGFKQTKGNKLRLSEFWVDWDIAEEGMDVALVCTIERNSGDYVRIDFNPFFNQEKPYSVARFMRDENSFYGIGLGEMGLDHQDEITAIHNQRIDNGTVLNSAMFAVRKDNQDITADELIYPGKIWRLNTVEDIKVLNFGAANPIAGSIATEDATMKYHQMRTAVGDWMMGQQNQSSAYGTAFAYQQLGLNSTKRQGEFLRELRNALSESGTRVLELYQQYNQRGKEFFALGQQDGTLVRQVLQFPLDLIRRGLKVSVTAIDVSNSKDARMRSNMIAMQGLVQYYQQVFQALQIAGNPQMPPELRQTALDMIRGSSILMHQVLDDQGVQEADKMLPRIAGVLDAQTQQFAALQQLLASGGRGSSMAGGPPGPQGMGGVPQLGGQIAGVLPSGPPQGGGYQSPQGAGSAGFAGQVG